MSMFGRDVNMDLDTSTMDIVQKKKVKIKIKGIDLRKNTWQELLDGFCLQKFLKEIDTWNYTDIIWGYINTLFPGMIVSSIATHMKSINTRIYKVYKIILIYGAYVFNDFCGESIGVHECFFHHRTIICYG